MNDKSIADADTVKRAWQKHNQEHFLYFRTLSLYTKLEAVEGMADTVRRFQDLRDRRNTQTPPKNDNR